MILGPQGGGVHGRAERTLRNVADFLLGGGKFPPLLSLGVTVALIAGGVIWSLVKTKAEEPAGG